MAQFIYPFPSHAIHDLEHLADLSDAPDLPLFLSERTLYVLQNIVDREATWASRYATSLVDGGYNRVEEEDEEYALYLECVEGLQREVIIQRMNWTEFTPRCWQPASEELTLDQVDGQYYVLDTLVHFYAAFVVDEAGASGRVIFRLPTDYPPARITTTTGTFLMVRSGVVYAGLMKPYTTDRSFQELWVSGQTGKFGQSPSFPLAVGDEFALQGFYRWEPE